MRIACINTLEQLAPYADDWDRLAAGMPFRGWTWLSSWWRHYGPGHTDSTRKRLAVLCVFDDTERLAGIAPWYLDSSALHGRVLKSLGSGEICSDYLGILTQPPADRIVEMLADYLAEQAQSKDPDALRWDLLELDGIDAEDHEMPAFTSRLAKAGCSIHRAVEVNCWRLHLPTTWDAYVAGLSKNLRRDARRLDRELIQSGRAILHVAESHNDVRFAMDILIDLHQRRRIALGEPGCFASSQFTAFYRDVVPRLLRQGKVEFYWLELDGKPAAAEYQLVGEGVLYEYQAGMSPEAAEHQAGKLINLAILRHAIERGYREFDFLRGDEPYKSRFGAQARPLIALRVAPARIGAQLRHNLWLAGDNLKQWVKRGLGRSPSAEPISQTVATP